MKQYLTIFLFLFVTCAFGQINNRGVNLSNNTQTFSNNVKMVVVGVSKYQNVPSLNYAHKDAQAFYNFMTSPSGGKIDTNNTRILLNERATAANIWTAVYWLLDEVKEGETVIIYFAGHGDLERKTISQLGYLLASDAPKVMYPVGGTIAVNVLQEFINTLVQKNKARVILISDACHSGKLAGGIEGVSNTNTALQAQWDNTIKILSSQPGELSQESTKWNGGGGVFTYYLIKGLMGFADRNHDNKVTVQEIDMYLMDNVSKETNFLQNPSFSGDQMAVLSVVDTMAFAKARATENNLTFSNAILAQRGFEDEYEKTLDTATLHDYKEFRYCIEHHYLLSDEDKYIYHTCAWNQFKKLKDNKNALPIMNNVRYSLLAALQTRYQTFVNYIINNVNFIELNNYIDTTVGITIRELEKTLVLVDSTYILYNHLKASYLAMKAFRAAYRNYDNVSDFRPNIDKAINLEPDNPIFYLINGLILNQTGDNNGAIQNLEKALELSPKCSSVTFLLGITYQRYRDYDNAILYNEKTIKIDSTHMWAFRNLAAIYISLKNEEKAKNIFEKAIIIFPENSEPYYWLGNIYKEEKNKEKADLYYNKAIQIGLADAAKFQNSKNSYYYLFLYYNIACYYSLIENKGEALKYMELSLQKGFKDFDHIKVDTDLDYIRNTEEFNNLINKYSKK
jgi:protein O-mannosyl-transferase